MQALHEFPRFGSLCRFFQGQELYLVGGTVRDLLLGRGLYDLDLIIPRDCLGLVQTFTRREHIPGFPMHKEMGVFRAIPAKGYTLDFTALQGNTLREDLFNRDFTMNALAVSLDEIASIKDISQLMPALIDPTNGYADLRDRTIRVIRPEAFMNDPLRLLRVFRFMVELDCQVEQRTLEFVAQHRQRLVEVSPERTVHELFRILAGHLDLAIQPMISSGLYRVLSTIIAGRSGINTDCPDRLIKLGQFIQKLEGTGPALPALSPENQAWLHQYFKQTLSGDITLRALFRYFLLFPTQTDLKDLQRACHDLTLANEALRILSTWWQARARLVEYLEPASPLSTHETRRLLFHYREAVPIACLGLGISPEEATGLPWNALLNLLEAVLIELNTARPSAEALLEIISGRYIMGLTGLRQGRDLGEILQTVREAIYTGELETEAQCQQKIWALMNSRTASSGS
ncbi:CCA tRNA nucleotidyltransferase [bacterium]|nr:CCA tRNA nucleotidyltransferase [bacterium]